MDYRLDKGAHSVYALHYHFIQCVKYRRDVFVDDRYVDLLKTKVHEISSTFDVDVNYPRLKSWACGCRGCPVLRNLMCTDLVHTQVLPVPVG